MKLTDDQICMIAFVISILIALAGITYCILVGYQRGMPCQ